MLQLEEETAGVLSLVRMKSIELFYKIEWKAKFKSFLLYQKYLVLDIQTHTNMQFWSNLLALSYFLHWLHHLHYQKHQEWYKQNHVCWNMIYCIDYVYLYSNALLQGMLDTSVNQQLQVHNPASLHPRYYKIIM